MPQSELGEYSRWTISSISIAAAHEVDLVERDVVVAVENMGLEGDRHFGNLARQVTVQSREELDRAAVLLGAPIETANTRRNITVSAGSLPRVRGQRLRVGDVLLEVFADAAPCTLMEELIGPGARTALKKLAGIHCRVISGGEIHVGAEIRLAAAASPGA